MNHHFWKLSASIAGTLAPVFCAIRVFGLGALEPGYNHMTDMMSILGGVEGIRGWIFNIGVIIIGLLIVIFGIGLHYSLNDSEGSRIGPAMLFLGGIGLVSSGIFHCDVDCACVIARTTLGILHMISAAIAGMFIAISLFVIYFRVRRIPLWQKYGVFTLLMAIIGNGSGILLWISYFSIRMTEIEGLIQRIGIIFPLIWIGVISLQILQNVKNQ